MKSGSHGSLRLLPGILLQGKDSSSADSRSSIPEALCDVAVVEACMKSSDAQGSFMPVEGSS